MGTFSKIKEDNDDNEDDSDKDNEESGKEKMDAMKEISVEIIRKIENRIKRG